MNPFFIISTPRDRGSLLARILDEGQSVRCTPATENILSSLRSAHAFREENESWNNAISEVLRSFSEPDESTDFYGIRDVFSHGREWKDAMDLWSWIHHLMPESKLIFILRDDEEQEKSLFFTESRWIGRYGKCSGDVLKRVRSVKEHMESYHEMNPTRTILLDSADILDFDKLRETLDSIGIPITHDAWARGISSVEDSGKKQAARRPDWPEFSPASLPPPENNKRAVVWPWLSTAAAWEELRFSMRSVAHHLTDKECPLFILGDKRPEWLGDHPRIRFLERASYEDALTTGVSLAEEIIWMNDDICLLEDMDFPDIVPLHGKNILPDAHRLLTDHNSYRRGTGKAAIALENIGFKTVLDFATHTPYRWEREKARETLEKFGVFRKIPFETIYHNSHSLERAREITTEKSRGKIAEGAKFLSYRDASLTDDLKAAISARFPDPAGWERG